MAINWCGCTGKMTTVYVILLMSLLTDCVSCSKMTNDYRKTALDAHNNYRKTENAANMRWMKWDCKLEEKAHKWLETNGCKLKHNPDRKIEGYRSVGENLYYEGNTAEISPDFQKAVDRWYNEKPDYSFDDNTCPAGKQCGHYKQVVWHNTYAVGCGMCKKKDGKFNKIYYACNYGPSGNFRGQKPYTKGAKCSACPKGTSCVDDMCMVRGSDDPIPQCAIKRHRPMALPSAPMEMASSADTKAVEWTLLLGAGIVVVLCRLT